MLMTNDWKLLIAGFASALGGCGGGGGGGVASTPASPTIPVIPITIFAAPTSQTYASVGTSSTAVRTQHYPFSDVRITDVSFAAPDQPQLRFTASGTYEVLLPQASYDMLVQSSADSLYFHPSSVSADTASFAITGTRFSGYTYSELAEWSDNRTGRWGFVAFGTPTLGSAVPTSGSATFVGTAKGRVDTLRGDPRDGLGFASIEGNVRLNVDFAHQALTGAFTLEVQAPFGGNGPVNLGSFAIAPTRLPAGSNSFTGAFQTAQSGFNRIDGLFTGTAAQEAIGAWALPVAVDGGEHQAMGAWIAKQGN